MMPKVLRKLFVTTMTMFILLTVFSLPQAYREKTVPVNGETEDIVAIKTTDIYLLNEDGYLVRSKVVLEGTREKSIKKILYSLIVSEENKYSNGLRGIIPNKTKILNIVCGSEIITIDFSKEILGVNVSDEKNMLSAIVFSILELDGVNGVSILVEGKELKEYPNSKEKLPNVLTKDIGINKQYNIKSRDNIMDVVVWYTTSIDEEIHYVPVTKYINDDRDKIKIIVEELTTSNIYEENLMSFLNSKAKLIDYKEENNILFLNFNEYLFDSKDKILEEVIYSIGYSVFDNYNVDMVSLLVDGKEVKHIARK